MIVRKRIRSSLRLTFLERHTQRRLSSISATTGCQIFVLEKDTTLPQIPDTTEPSITIINNQQFLTTNLDESQPLGSTLLNLVDLPPQANPYEFLEHRHRFDSTILISNSNLGTSTLMQSILYGIAKRTTSLTAIPFCRWGAAQVIENGYTPQTWKDKVCQFSRELDLSPEIKMCHLQVLQQLSTDIYPKEHMGQLELEADGCFVVMKIRVHHQKIELLIPKLLDLSALAVGFCQQHEESEIIVIQRQHSLQAPKQRVELFLYYSPRNQLEQPSLEEAG